VLDAADSVFEQAGTTRQGIAAALCAAADQVVPEEPDYMRDAVPSTDWWDKHDQVRSELLALANELEGQ
jgi:hypothetical protein